MKKYKFQDKHKEDDGRSTGEKAQTWWLNVKFYIKNLPAIKHLLIAYVSVTLTGALLLLLPISQTPEYRAQISFMDTLFHAASAFSDTGLVTLPTYAAWTPFGQSIIATLILVGGIGVFAIKVFIFNTLFKRSTSYVTRGLVTAERGTSDVTKSKRIIKISVTMLLITILISSVTLTIYFYYTEVDMDLVTDGIQSGIAGEENFSAALLGVSPYKDFATALRYGIFHSISAINNAGFDIIGPVSLAPYYNHHFVQTVFMILFIMGGVGYPVLYDCYRFVKTRFTKKRFQWSLFSKISMFAYLFISVLGVALAFTFETTSKDPNAFWNAKDILFYAEDGKTVIATAINPLGSHANRSFALVFNTLSTRNAGFASIAMQDLSEPTLIVYSIMMFIGSAPASTAGGIRTTTFAIVMLSIIGKLRSQDKVRVFKKRISYETVSDSYTVFTISIILVMIGALVGLTSFSDHSGLINVGAATPKLSNPFSISGIDERYNLVHMLFEVSSAFGTTGLSTGITSSLSVPTQIILIFIMFTGQLGISTSIQFWGKRAPRSKRYDYIQEDVLIG